MSRQGSDKIGLQKIALDEKGTTENQGTALQRSGDCAPSTLPWRHHRYATYPASHGRGALSRRNRILINNLGFITNEMSRQVNYSRHTARRITAYDITLQPIFHRSHRSFGRRRRPVAGMRCRRVIGKNRTVRVPILQYNWRKIAPGYLSFSH